MYGLENWCKCLAETLFSISFVYKYHISRLVLPKTFLFVIPFLLSSLYHRKVFFHPFSHGYGAPFHFVSEISFRFTWFFIDDGSQCYVDRQGWIARVDQFKGRASGLVLFAAVVSRSGAGLLVGAARVRHLGRTMRRLHEFQFPCQDPGEQSGCL